MTAAPRFSDAVPIDASQSSIWKGNQSMSPGKYSHKRQALTYRQHFVDCWSQFIRENFDSPEHAAMVFGVEGSTARKWWAGNHAPSGFAVGYAYTLAPEAAAKHLGAEA